MLEKDCSQTQHSTDGVPPHNVVFFLTSHSSLSKATNTVKGHAPLFPFSTKGMSIVSESVTPAAPDVANRARVEPMDVNADQRHIDATATLRDGLGIYILDAEITQSAGWVPAAAYRMHRYHNVLRSMQRDSGPVAGGSPPIYVPVLIPLPRWDVTLVTLHKRLCTRHVTAHYEVHIHTEKRESTVYTPPQEITLAQHDLSTSTVMVMPYISNLVSPALMYTSPGSGCVCIFSLRDIESLCGTNEPPERSLAHSSTSSPHLHILLTSSTICTFGTIGTGNDVNRLGLKARRRSLNEWRLLSVCSPSNSIENDARACRAENVGVEVELARRLRCQSRPSPPRVFEKISIVDILFQAPAWSLNAG
ncbi:hypothetical protein K504DRAFT_445397 [Pleomassaria siparia CBS 279.74]|uniref:Uncharacterized protein n=1 Tax=Pleomassaria siparia CBS 279.74 TaxID=1314801 RepID=A0A6G1KNK6_9PLEO|nr:hypothetical protein K504DRAFT_445397 [Pleomassaria siparia CBS 279.74]